ncbi:exonuclease VII small subunit [Candidatus Pelagibacter sp.]|jgi:exonuclease VII small subunit|nr:exonuclease VII small subunit [Candidatus Pelagibacter sp.]|tara:strand:- start:1 stop:234 length:234 start_codon:yes stop_codon:yes gene_type:complete
MNEKNLPDDINSKTLDELTQEAQKLINKLEKDENLQNSISSYQELVKLNKIIEKKFFRESQNITKDVKDKINKILNK